MSDEVSPPLQFSYDAQMDMMTIEGVEYSGEMLRSWALNKMQVSRWFRFIKRDSGETVIETKENMWTKLEVAFMAVLGAIGLVFYVLAITR